MGQGYIRFIADRYTMKFSVVVKFWVKKWLKTFRPLIFVVHLLAGKDKLCCKRSFNKHSLEVQ